MKLSPEEITPAVCRQLLGRDTFWRADPPSAVSTAIATPSAPSLRWTARLCRACLRHGVQLGSNVGLIYHAAELIHDLSGFKE